MCSAIPELTPSCVCLTGLFSARFHIQKVPLGGLEPHEAALIGTAAVYAAALHVEVRISRSCDRTLSHHVLSKGLCGGVLV